MFLMEGVFDCIFVKNAVAIGGVALTPYQEDLISKYMCDLVWFFDNQHQDSRAMIETIKKLKESPKNKVFIWPKINAKDVNDGVLGDENFINNINSTDWINSHIYSGAKGLLKLQWRN